MYFKVDRKVLKKALIWLKAKLEDEVSNKNILFPSYIEQIEFALYKTKIDEFYIDYNLAQAIRPALLTKKETKKYGI